MMELTFHRKLDSQTQSIQELFAAVGRHISQLNRVIQRKGDVEASFQNAGDTLEMLPLATDEFDLARLRLRNARSYEQAGENGAARYELKLLEGWLQAKALAC